MTSEQIRAAIHAAMGEVAERFARDPRPTDGSVRAELEVRRRLGFLRDEEPPPAKAPCGRRISD
jgi:hypothetical protein